MGSLSKLIKEKGGEFGEIRTGQLKVQQIHYTKLKESALNFYTRSDDEVEELADTMLIAGGILQPLIVRKTDMSEYEILAGHKRKRASVYNVDRGYKEFEFLPCIVIDMSGLMAKKISEKILAEQGDVEDDELLDMIAEYIVICTNSTASESSHYEKMMQAVRLSKILPAMLGNEELKGRALRAEIAKEMKCGDGQVGRYQRIYNNLVPEAMELFKNGKINLSVASSLSGLDESSQQEVLKRPQITTSDIENLKRDKNTESVSNLDTKEAHGTEFLVRENDSRSVSNLDTDNAHRPIEMPYLEKDAAGCGDSEQAVKAGDEGRQAAVVGEETAASEKTEITQQYSAGYTMEEVQQIYDEQAARIRQIEWLRKNKNLSAADEWQYKKAKIIRDGMTYILEAFKEGTIC